MQQFLFESTWIDTDLTCPGLCWAVLASLVEDCVEHHQQQEGGVEGEDSLGAAKLPVIGHIQPGAEEKDPAHAIKGGLHQEEHQVDGGQGALLSPVPVIQMKLTVGAFLLTWLSRRTRQRRKSSSQWRGFWRWPDPPSQCLSLSRSSQARAGWTRSGKKTKTKDYKGLWKLNSAFC